MTLTIDNKKIKNIMVSPDGVSAPVYIDRVFKGSQLVFCGAYKDNELLFESDKAGTYNLELQKAGLYEITMVGGGGAAAMRGVYDDRGYGWSGGSGGAFKGTFNLERGNYSLTVASANNNTKSQGGNSNTLNPADMTTHDTYITGVVRVGGGGSGHYNANYVGAAGASATFEITPKSIEFNKTGTAGASGSGGKGSGANWTHQGGASVYNGYGKGQGCSTSEYASRRYWIAGTGGYIRIVYIGQKI